jgi:hypothetical protein
VEGRGGTCSMGRGTMEFGVSSSMVGSGIKNCKIGK